MSRSASPDGLEQVAARKLIYRLAELDGADLDPTEQNPIDAVNRAVDQVESMVDRIDDLEATVERLESDTVDPDAREYSRMDKHEKAAVVRQKLREVAKNTGGKAAYNYKDVIRVFDGQPSSGHAYDIMDVAGQADRFEYGEAPDGSKRLTVDLA